MISFLSHLKHRLGIVIPRLVLIPATSLQNWARESKQRTPDFNIVLTGTKYKNAEIIVNRLIPQAFEVYITSYKICLIEKSALKKISFDINAAHPIKKVDSILSLFCFF